MSVDAIETGSTIQGEKPGLYSFVMMIICLFSLLIILAKFGLRQASPEMSRALDLFDSAVCVVFFVDFLRTLYRAPNRWRYFYTWGWLDILSCIPDIDALRIGRLARLFRLIRLFRVIKSTRTLWLLLVNRNMENTLFAIGSFAILTISAGACGILIAEQNADKANIINLEDALWWAFSTITTIGYGDLYPVTGYGRLIAVALAVVGIGLIGLFTASLAAVLSRQAQREPQQQD